MRVLAISGSLRDASNSTALLRALREEAPEGVEVVLWDGLKSMPPYDQDDDVVPAPAARRGVPRARARGRRSLLRDARVQLVDPRRAQERARLGLAPDRDERVPQQARRGDQLERRRVRRRLGRGASSARCSARWARASPRPSWPSATRTRSSTTQGRLVDDDVRAGLREALETLLAEVAPVERRGLSASDRVGVRHLFVLGQPPLHDRTGQHSDELAVVDDGHALVVVLLEIGERVGEHAPTRRSSRSAARRSHRASSSSDRARARRPRGRASSV